MEAASGEGEEGLADRLGERRTVVDVVRHVGRFGIPADDHRHPDADAEPLPERRTELPAPPANPPGQPQAEIPPALVQHARKIADDHRARTGTAIDATTLRARLGVAASLAEAIAAQLT